MAGDEGSLFSAFFQRAVGQEPFEFHRRCARVEAILQAADMRASRNVEEHAAAKRGGPAEVRTTPSEVRL